MVSAGGRQRVVTLSTPLTGPIVRTAPFDTGTTLFLGLAKGEWGGGLERIDTITGTVNEVPGLVLVRTDVDAHVSLGGGAPLLVAR